MMLADSQHKRDIKLGTQIQENPIVDGREEASKICKFVGVVVVHC